MRAVVLLCLLHVTFGQEDVYSFDVDGPETNPGVACDAGAGPCGCCKMLQEVNRLGTYFDRSLEALEVQSSKAENLLKTMAASRTAVSVALFTNEKFKCYGPFAQKTIIKYQHVFLNMGGAYDTATGMLTISHSGVYHIALTIYSDAGAPANSLAACAGLQVNGILVAGSSDRNMNDQEDSATIAVIVQLKTGDLVAVNLPKGCFLCDGTDHYNTFNAFLIHHTG